jgi:hypothetical protein
MHQGFAPPPFSLEQLSGGDHSLKLGQVNERFLGNEYPFLGVQVRSGTNPSQCQYQCREERENPNSHGAFHLERWERWERSRW